MAATTITTTMHPVPVDAFPTLTSTTQAETEKVLREHMPTADKPPTLQKNPHLQFLIRNFTQGMPSRYMSYDASQPWLLFWTLQAFSVLQIGMDPDTKQRAIDMLLECQHPDGGFGGGPKQAPHLLPTYAAVCALAIVGRPGQNGGWDSIDRKKMYNFFMSLKQPDGSFLVSQHSEVDTRGIYCLLVVATLLDIITPELVEGTAHFIASCQTYEGGFSSTSQPYYSADPSPANLLPFPRPALGEAHGGYTFCGLASWVMLQPFLPSTSTTKPSIDKNKLVRWLVQMQGVQAEMGGFKGRTNKLVDGCYSWWVGGAFGLLDSIGINPTSVATPEADGADWVDVDDSLFNRKALQEYILCAGQHPAGGLRDKPPKHADAYHTLYCLSGLSAAQHKLSPSSSRRKQLADAWVQVGDNMELRQRIFLDSLCYSEEEGTDTVVGGAANRVNATHPIFNLTVTHTEAIMGHFYGQTIPQKTTRLS
ncbi:Protein farnesyltransferase subunit beta [Mycena indigotica]|uniref:Protein farnesyltransferase subunit beta n=1 Tax=Mycena indigotica TaxID=2126181 RepID=A0A8H6S0V9_9AGAR|nr:Protein farnesyltransferase subunit beta [Mycena indigotica]KAF7290563.1 Protein farnesyltransferase subunit beta [Mycena indigotica]